MDSSTLSEQRGPLLGVPLSDLPRYGFGFSDQIGFAGICYDPHVMEWTVAGVHFTQVARIRYRSAKIRPAHRVLRRFYTSSV